MAFTLLLQQRFPAEAVQLREIRQAVIDVLSAQGCGSDKVDQWVLAVNEACMNIIQHAYGPGRNGDIVLEIGYDQHSWIFRLIDFADPVDQSKICPRDLNDIRPGGLGVHFIREAMDTVQFLESGDQLGNILEMRSSRK